MHVRGVHERARDTYSDEQVVGGARTGGNLAEVGLFQVPDLSNAKGAIQGAENHGARLLVLLRDIQDALDLRLGQAARDAALGGLGARDRARGVRRDEALVRANCMC